MYNWICPYCDRAQTVTSERMSNTDSVIWVGETTDGRLALTGLHISCANALCQRTTINVAVRQTKIVGGNCKTDYAANPIFERQIVPDSSAKMQPDFIPKPLVEDYVEACRIRDLSPKAAATLVRRCLQGMIRDFAKIKDRTLNAEIDRLRKAVGDGTAPQGVTDETVEAIDHVRKVGNIGAHMEHDINHIIDVGEGEADALISLVEMLFDEWYVARKRREDRLAKIAGIATAKDELKAQQRSE